jgi:predicted protein tyrosine phosphatase
MAWYAQSSVETSENGLAAKADTPAVSAAAAAMARIFFHELYLLKKIKRKMKCFPFTFRSRDL